MWIKKVLMLVLADILIVLISYFMALLLRFDFVFSSIPEEYLMGYLWSMPFWIISTIVIFYICRLYHSIWRLASVAELQMILIAYSILAVVYSLGMLFMQMHMPRSYYFIGFLLNFLMTTGLRFSYRLMRFWVNSRNTNADAGGEMHAKDHVMVIGAGAAGQALIKEIINSKKLNTQVVCIIDDNPTKHGRVLEGITIVGDRYSIPEMAKKYKVDRIIYAIPEAAADDRKAILNICKDTGCRLQTVPGVYQLVNGEVSVSRLRNVEITDLLGRAQVQVNMDEIYSSIQGKTLLVTGGGGSIGSMQESDKVRAERVRTGQQYGAGQEGIDLFSMMDDALRCFQKYWLQFLLLIVIVTAVFIIYGNRQYVPQYQAKVTYAVNKTGDSDTDASIAQRLSNSISVVTKTGDFKDRLFADVEEENVNPNYVISSAYTDNSNLFSVTVTANNYNNANMLLDLLENMYPEWVAGSNGTIELQVVDRALAGENPVNGYSAMKQLVEGVLAGVILCLAIAALYAQLIRTVRKESDMKKITSKGCISLIPEIAVKKREKSKKQQLLLTNKRVDWGFKQSVQAAQLRIEKQMEQEHKQVLLVSSTLPQEGKSMTAVNLALAFMQHEKKTVLIDGDLRKPSVAEMLGMEEQKGLAEYLKGNAKVKEVLQKKGDLTVIQGGKVHGNISSLMDESRMEELMTFLKSEFDYVIIDTPPAYLFSDAAILAGYADCVLYVVRHDMAEIPQIEKGMESFIQEDKLLGYLINRSQKGFASYGKYGYGKYGYGKYGYGKYGKYQRYVDVKEDDMDTEDSL